MNISQVLVQIMAIDLHTKSVLIIYNDYLNLIKLAIWVPVNSLSATEISVRPSSVSNSLGLVMEEFQEVSKNMISFSAK